MIKFACSLVIAALLLAATILPVTAQPISGQSGAQQIYFSCPSGIQGVSVADYVVVRGRNQSGTVVRWQGWAAWANDKWSTFAFTRDWWWTGKVQIFWWDAQTNSWAQGDYYLPSRQGGSIAYLTCEPR